MMQINSSFQIKVVIGTELSAWGYQVLLTQGACPLAHGQAELRTRTVTQGYQYTM